MEVDDDGYGKKEDAPNVDMGGVSMEDMEGVNILTGIPLATPTNHIVELGKCYSCRITLLWVTFIHSFFLTNIILSIFLISYFPFFINYKYLYKI